MLFRRFHIPRVQCSGRKADRERRARNVGGEDRGPSPINARRWWHGKKGCPPGPGRGQNRHVNQKARVKRLAFPNSSSPVKFRPKLQNCAIKFEARFGDGWLSEATGANIYVR